MGKDTELKFMALNLAFLNYKLKECGTIGIKEGTVRNEKMVQ